MVSGIISSILLILSPFLIKGITNGVKKLQKVKLSSNKIFILRFVVAVLSFVTVAITSWVSGAPISNDIISAFAETVIVFLGSTGAYLLEKKKLE